MSLSLFVLLRTPPPAARNFCSLAALLTAAGGAQRKMQWAPFTGRAAAPSLALALLQQRHEGGEEAARFQLPLRGCARAVHVPHKMWLTWQAGAGSGINAR